MYTFGYILGVLVVSCIFGAITKHINESKGYEGGFAWGFWLSWIGIIVVACKSDNNRAVSGSPNGSSDEYWNRLSNSAPSNQWRCVCGTMNSNTIDYCPICHRTRAQNFKKACPTCGAMNNPGNAYCFACGKSMDAAVLALEAARQADAAKEKSAVPEAAVLENAADADTPSSSAVNLKKPDFPQVPAIGVKNATAGREAHEITLIRQLSVLHDEGILTDEEFSEKKAMLLSRI